MKQTGNRKIAANYIYWPGAPLVKNGYLECLAGQAWRVVDTGGVIRETAGLEFYGGLLVPAGVRAELSCFQPDRPILPVLDALYTRGISLSEVALIEGADLRTLTWKIDASIHVL